MKTYIVIKDDTVISAGEHKETQLDIAKVESGVNSNIPLGDVEVWEYDSIQGSKIIWRCCWESTGPLEPNICANYSSFPT